MKRVHPSAVGLERGSLEKGSIEDEFQRFRQEGDVDALGRVFDRTSPRLLALAGRLARDAADAEDLVQSTFLRALTKRDQWDSGRPLFPWLAGILNHHAQDIGRRSRVRRALPFDADDHPDGGSDDPSAIAAFADDRRAVLAAIEGLGEPYRELLTLRIDGGLDTPGLAAALGRPSATIRVQLSRGRERLEALLPKELGLTALLLLEPEPALHRLRSQVLADWTRLRAAGEITVKSAAGAASGWTGGKLLTFAALALAALVAVWQAASRGEPAPPQNVRTAGTATPAGNDASIGPGMSLLPSGPTRRATSPGESLVAAAPPSLQVSVAFDSAGDALEAAGVGVYVRRIGKKSLGLAGVTAEDGSVTFDDLERGRYAVHLGPSSAPPTEVAVLGPRTVQLTIPDGVDVEGRVLSFDGVPVGGANVYRVDAFHHDATQWLATTDSSGRFFAADVAPGAELFARAPGHQPTGGKRYGARNRVRGAAGSTQSLDLQLGARGLSLEGRVLGPDGQPSPHALVLIAVDEDARKDPNGVDPRQAIHKIEGSDVLDPNGERDPQDTDSFLVRADEDGVFRSDEVPRGTAAIFARSWEDASLIGTALVDVQGTGVTLARITLDEGAEVHGRVLDAQGHPRSGVVLEADWKGTPDLGQFESGFGENAFRGRAISGSDGRYRIVGLLAGETGLQVPNSSGRSLVGERVTLESSFEWNPIVPVHSDVRVRALNSHGDPLVGWQVCHAQDQHGTRRSDCLTTDSEGRVHFSGMSDRSVTVTLHPPETVDSQNDWIPIAYQTLRPSDEETLLVYDAAATCKVSGSVVLPEPPGEARRRSARVQLIFEGFDDVGKQELVADGAFAFDPLPPGSYRLVLDATSHGVARDQELCAFTIEPGESLDLGELVAPLGTKIVLDLQMPDGVAPLNPGVILREASDSSLLGYGIRLRRAASGEPYQSAPIAPGTYVLSLDERAHTIDHKVVEVLPGVPEQRVVWAVESGVTVDWEIYFDRQPTTEEIRPNCESTEGRVDIDVFDESWTPLRDSRITQAYDSGAALVMTLRRSMAPGAYRMSIEDERFDGWDKSWTTVDFLVTRGAENRVVVHLTEPYRAPVGITGR